MNLKLIRPSCEYAEQVMKYKEEMHANRDSFDGCAGLEEVNSVKRRFCSHVTRTTLLSAKPSRGTAVYWKMRLLMILA